MRSSPIRGLYTSRPRPERAALLAGERALDQALGEGRAIELDERAGAPRAIMDTPREQLLPPSEKYAASGA